MVTGYACKALTMAGWPLSPCHHVWGKCLRFTTDPSELGLFRLAKGAAVEVAFSACLQKELQCLCMNRAGVIRQQGNSTSHHTP